MGSVFKKAIYSSLLLVGLSAVCSEGAEFDDLYKKGEQAFASKNYAAAAENYSQALSYSPADLRARFRYGQSLFLMQKYKESGSQFQTILQNAPGNISARMFYAESLINLGQSDAAKPHLQWILKVQPTNERAKLVLDQIDEQESFVPEKIPVGVKPVKEVKSDEVISYSANKKQNTAEIKKTAVSNSVSTANTVKFISEKQKADVAEAKAVLKQNSKKSSNKKVAKKMANEVNQTAVSNNSVSTAKNKQQVKQTDGFIYIAPRPASILPVEYQYDNEEDKFMNYPAENDNSVSYRNIKIKPVKQIINVESAASPAVKLEDHSAKAKALEALSPAVRAQVEATAAADAYRKKTIEKVDSSVYTTAEAFADKYRGSYVICLERARYFMEKGDLKKAGKWLSDSEQLAYDAQNSAALLECRIFEGLLYIYKLDYKSFGHHILALKSSLKPENYQAYLDIYNQGAAAKNEYEKARLAAGVAMGASHFAVAADLLQKAFDKDSSDPVLGRLLSDAQLQCRNFKGAEKTLNKLTELYPDSAEAYYNLAKFYITAEFKPDMARKYAEKAAQLSSNDPKCGIVLGLVDFTEGKVDAGLDRIKALMPSLNEDALKNICERIIIEGENNPRADFAAMLAVPGSKKASAESYRMFGEDSLKRGMYFSALESYEQIGDKAELGRTLLAMASAMKNAEEASFSNQTAEIGLTILSEAVSKNPHDARANLYLALYQYDNGNYELAKMAVERGLNGNPDMQTKSRLASVQRVIETGVN